MSRRIEAALFIEGGLWVSHTLINALEISAQREPRAQLFLDTFKFILGEIAHELPREADRQYPFIDTTPTERESALAKGSRQTGD